MLKDFTLGDSLRFTSYYRTGSGTLFDPGSTWGRIYDAASVVVASPSLFTRVTTGIYAYEWQTDPASNVPGTGAFQAFGYNAGQTYTTRETLFKLV
jgi:hypothetical protein